MKKYSLSCITKTTTKMHKASFEFGSCKLIFFLGFVVWGLLLPDYGSGEGLQITEFFIDPTFSDQVIMIASFNDLPFFQHDDLIGMLNG